MKTLNCTKLLTQCLAVLICFLLLGCGGNKNYRSQERVSYDPRPIPECERRGFGYVKYINTSKHDISVLSNDINRGTEIGQERYVVVDRVPCGVYNCQFRYIGKKRSKLMSRTFRVDACEEVEVILD